MVGPAGEEHPEVLQPDLPLNLQARRCKTPGLHVEHVEVLGFHVGLRGDDPDFCVGKCAEVHGELLELHGEQGSDVSHRGGGDDLQLHF